VRSAVLRGGGRWLADAPLALAGSLTVHGALPLETVPKDSVLCAHHPTVFDHACAVGFDVVLTGHLHGGQFVLAERGGLLYPGALLYRYNGLRFERGGTTMLVSRGVHDTLALRWSCPREVLLVEL
jgi:predicted MPP superfamily phosphohydrolase